MKGWIRRWLGILETEPLRAIELKRGAVYVIESDHDLSADDVTDIYAYLTKFKKITGCEFLLLDQGLSVAVDRG
jgi:hypothetical protein